jgi:hypothetical protein
MTSTDIVPLQLERQDAGFCLIVQAALDKDAASTAYLALNRHLAEKITDLRVQARDR